jgi:hypothetical protein
VTAPFGGASSGLRSAVGSAARFAVPLVDLLAVFVALFADVLVDTDFFFVGAARRARLVVDVWSTESSARDAGSAAAT